MKRLTSSFKVIAAVIIAGLFSACASIPAANRGVRHNADELFQEMDGGGHEGVPGVPKNSGDDSVSSATGDIPTLDKPHVFKFTETGVWAMSKDETQLYAEGQAENDALAKALRSSGLETYYGFSDLQGQAGDREVQAVSRYLQTWSNGAAKWERIGKAEFQSVGDGLQCVVRIKGEVAFMGEPDPNFNIRFKHSDRDLGLSKSVMKEGENVEFSALLTKPAYIQVLSVDQEQNVFLIYPNAYSDFLIAQADEVFYFPPPGSALALRAALPAGMDHTTEAIQIIATKTEPLFTKAELSGIALDGYAALSAGKLKEVMSKLALLKRSDWTMAVLPYQIVK